MSRNDNVIIEAEVIPASVPGRQPHWPTMASIGSS
jgi:hypothetical protein